MPDYLYEKTIQTSIDIASADLIGQLEGQVTAQLAADETPVRLAVTKSDGHRWTCEVGVLVGSTPRESIFHFTPRARENEANFNAVMLVPTGIGAEIGGHAGDATPAATLIASVCDTLVTHPNVLNASDIIQIPSNTLYVEGSVIARLLMGTVGLEPTRGNRLLVVVQAHNDQLFTSAAINSVNAARASYGLHVAEIVEIESGFRMVSEYGATGVAAGRVEGLGYLWDILDRRQGEFDAVAITSVIDVPAHYHRDYYEQRGRMVNPWGGVEAMVTHALSCRYHVPAAHAPMLESREVADLDVGVVDSRMAAEVVSMTFMQSVLRGLQFSPHLAHQGRSGEASLTVEDLSCMVIPAGSLGIPTLAALGQGVPVISVRENENVMRNRLDVLPWKPGGYYEVESYWEAAGLVAALRIGLDPMSVRRPLRDLAANTLRSRPAGSGNTERIPADPRART